jgi:hypothetical protein
MLVGSAPPLFVLTDALRRQWALTYPTAKLQRSPVHGVNFSMSSKPDPKSGRVAYDDRGQPVWEWRVDTGVFSRDVDTKRMRQIQEDAQVKLQHAPASAPALAPRRVGFDPYSTATTLQQPMKPRRTLDDMRKLSEEIKKNRQRK